MHFRAGVVQGRDAQENIVPGLAVVLLFSAAGADQRQMVVEDGLGEAGGAGGKVNGRVIGVRQLHRGRAGGAEVGEAHTVLAVGRSAAPHEKQHFHLVQAADNGVHPGDELRAEHQHLHIRQVQAIFDLVAGIAEVHGDGDAAGL